MNYESKNKLEINDITKNIEIKLEKKECENIGNERKWIRTCPICKKEIFHKNEISYNQSILYNKKCYSCSHMGRKITEKAKQKIREKISGINNYHFGKPGVNLGKSHSKEHCLKISLGKKGIKWSDARKEKMRQLQNTDEYRKKCRESAIRRMLKQQLDGNISFRSYNSKACEYLNKLNEEKGWNLQHALNGGEVEICGYFLDGYDKDKNIVVEYDENHHYNSNWSLKDKDLYRMNIIKKYLHCDFYRYNEVFHKLTKI